MSPAADSFVGEGLADSPYVEVCKERDLWQENYYKLLEFYQEVCEYRDELLDHIYERKQMYEELES